MLRIDRRTLPALPRPVFEIQAEHTAEGDIRVTVMAGQGEDSRMEEFPLTGRPLLERRLTQWFRGLPYFVREHRDWARVSDQAVTLIGRWTGTEKFDTPLSQEMGVLPRYHGHFKEASWWAGARPATGILASD